MALVFEWWCQECCFSLVPSPLSLVGFEVVRSSLSFLWSACLLVGPLWRLLIALPLGIGFAGGALLDALVDVRLLDLVDRRV